MLTQPFQTFTFILPSYIHWLFPIGGFLCTVETINKNIYICGKYCMDVANLKSSGNNLAADGYINL